MSDVSEDDRVSTEQLWELLSARLRSFIRSRVSNDEIAEDLLQETFVRIHKKIDTLHDQQRITAWIFQIARNLVIDYYRTNGRFSTTSEIGDLHADLEEDANLNELVIGWLPSMIARLPAADREAVELYELQGRPQQEIADRLGISLSGAKSRVQRGRNKLKMLLFDCCHFERDRRGSIIDYQKKGDEDCGHFCQC